MVPGSPHSGIVLVGVHVDDRPIVRHGPARSIATVKPVQSPRIGLLKPHGPACPNATVQLVQTPRSSLSKRHGPACPNASVQPIQSPRIGLLKRHGPACLIATAGLARSSWPGWSGPPIAAGEGKGGPDPSSVGAAARNLIAVGIIATTPGNARYRAASMPRPARTQNENANNTKCLRRWQRRSSASRLQPRTARAPMHPLAPTLGVLGDLAFHAYAGIAKASWYNIYPPCE
jgi:hypothetical protein